MIKDRTSKILRAHQLTAETYDSWIYPFSKTEFVAIAEKYNRMEEALKWSQIEAHCTENELGCLCPVCKALAFDPVAP